MKSTVAELKILARSACSSALDSPALSEIALRLPKPETCFVELQRHGAAAVERWSLPFDDLSDLGRCVLLKAALTALEKVDSQLVSNRVKAFLLQDFIAYADPPAKWTPMFVPSTVRYAEMVRLVTFRRFPAGQFHWEPMRFPGSYLLKAGPGALRLFLSLVRAGGRGPMWEVHLNDRRPNAFLLLENGANKSYYRMAKSMQMQPGVKAITVGSWLYSREVADASPHLAWMRRHYAENGGVVTELDLAPLDSGFLSGDTHRKALYEEGKFHPRFTVAVWPRAAVLRWAALHPELEEE